MDSFLTFLANYWGYISGAIVVIGGILLGAGSVKSKLYQIAYYFVCKAEALLGSQTGQLKKAAVYSWIRAKLPASVRWFITDAFLDKLIEQAVTAMKEFLAKNPDVDLSKLTWE